MIHLLLHYFEVISFFIGLLTGLGSSWMYLGLRRKLSVLTRRQQTFYILGIVLVSIGLLLFLLILVFYFRIYGAVVNILVLVFVIIAVLVSLVIAIPSILFIKLATKDQDHGRV